MNNLAGDPLQHPGQHSAGLRSYSYDAEGRPISVGQTSIALDAFGRAVAEGSGSSWKQIVYSPTGWKFALMNSTTLIKYRIPMPGGLVATHNNDGTGYYQHSDRLGSSRIGDVGGVRYDRAYAPFGEVYAELNGTENRTFTGPQEDTTAGIDDFLFRQYSPSQGRWLSPDPAGKAAVDISNPQTWNRYAYLANDPLNAVDPYGLYRDDCWWYGNCYGNGGPGAGGGGGGGYYGGLSTPCTSDGISVSCGSLGGLGSNGMTPLYVLPSGAIIIQDAGGNWLNATQGVPLSDGDVIEFGYLGINNPNTPLGFTPWQWQSILSAKNGALHRLAAPKCSAFYGGKGSSVLSNTSYNPISVNSSIGALTVPGSTSVGLNVNGNALDPAQANLMFFTMLVPGGVSQGNALQVLMLHELGHEMNLSNYIQNDWGTGSNMINTIHVGNACGW